MKEHTEKQTTPPGEQKIDREEQEELTEEHRLPAGEQIALTEEQKKLTVEQKEHTGEQTLTDNQKEVIEEQTMPIEAKMEHPDERIAHTECQNILTEKATDEEQKATSGAAMDFSETNTEDSDSSYPDDLVPSQLQYTSIACILYACYGSAMEACQQL